jgi:hypothetical protein
LSQLDAGGWHSRAYAGEPLPSLRALAAFMHANAFALNIEIKPTPGLEQATGHAVGAACRGLWQDTATAPLLFSSFRPEALAGARETAPEVPRALLVDTCGRGWFDVARSLGCVAVVSNHRLMDAALLAQLHTAGLRGAVLHGERAGRRAAAAGPGHRRPDHRRGGPLFAAVAAAQRLTAVRGSGPPHSSASPAGNPPLRCRARAEAAAAADQRQRQATSTSSSDTPPAKASARAQPHVLTQPAAQQGAGPGRQQRQPAHGAVMRPSSGSGVTAWRSARKLMKMNTAPVVNSISISAKAATPQALAGATASSSQPVPQMA